jgi:type IX secretion system PorP/SprF family membrane protein
MPLGDVNGIGLNVANDKIGIQTRTTLNGAYAYKIRFNQNAILSAGVQATVNFFANDMNKIFTNNPTSDPAFTNGGYLSSSKPNFGAGLYFRNKILALGVSVPNLISSKINDSNLPSDARLKQHFLITAMFVAKINSDWMLRPGFFARYVENAPVQADINVSAIYRDRLWLGASWRTNAAVAFMAQFHLTKSLWLGYAYDYTTNALSSYQDGSHEFFVGYNYRFKKSNFLSPRYF